MNKSVTDGYLEAQRVIQGVVDAAARNPHTGAYIGCEHFRMKAAVAECEEWMKNNPVRNIDTLTSITHPRVGLSPGEFSSI